LCAAIRYHHEPAIAPESHRALASTTCVANLVGKLCEDPNDADLRLRTEGALSTIPGVRSTTLDWLLEHLSQKTGDMVESIQPAS
jgi:hypothetical protein